MKKKEIKFTLKEKWISNKGHRKKRKKEYKFTKIKIKN
jgi:hypothetical protein